MKMHNGDPLSPEMLAQLKRLEAMRDEDIDTSDMPEVTDWSQAVRGKYYRPVKKPYSLRLDVDVVDWFKAEGDGYQTRINAALREYVLNHQKRA
jgi:uncharacterized protein (DUF4415 family)